MAMEEYTREAALREDRGTAITLDMLEAHRVAQIAEARWGRAAQTMKLGEETGELATEVARVNLARIGITGSIPGSREAVAEVLEARVLGELADVILVALSLFPPDRIASELAEKAKALESRIEGAIKADARASR